MLRDRLKAYGIHKASDLWTLRNGAIAKAAGLVLIRQRPGSASGVIFTTLEDETGTVNVVVWPSFAEAQRQALLKAQLLAVTGSIQQESGVLHLIAGRLEDLTAWLGDLDARSRDFSLMCALLWPNSKGGVFMQTIGLKATVIERKNLVNSHLLP